ncbi:MAG: DUF3568 family protein [Deltaproteobacteria bacterium]|nr:DUF3568 family protein [Deltaproteobacteria bacterium]
MGGGFAAERFFEHWLSRCSGRWCCAGGGAVAYIRGELKTTEEVSLNRSWRAAQTAMSDLEFTITDKEKGRI